LPSSTYTDYYNYNSTTGICYLLIEEEFDLGGGPTAILGDSFLRNYYVYHDSGLGR
jgi:hypothetical protein